MIETDYEKTSLWRASFLAPEYQADLAACNRLREEFFNIRIRAEMLVSRISKDNPGLTVHDVSHLDALWETASLIAGPDYTLNPAEGFVLGGAIMLHDAAMCLAAFPNGIRDLSATNEWRDAVALSIRRKENRRATLEDFDNPQADVIQEVLPEILRALHAKRARELPRIQWPLPDGQSEYIIRDGDLRSIYGELIGKLAESHWWPVEDLRTGLPVRVNAGPGVPSQWHVDPLKIACLLRVADAAHIDHRRAPRFLRAIIQPSGTSGLHWTFQGKIGKPSLDNDKIVFTGASFSIEEAESWWLCFDTIKMVDSELRGVDVALQANNRPRFAARAVKAAGSPEALLQFIGTEGWQPVDTELRVSNVPNLVKLLGGEKLYGADPHVPLRELVQNAADAIRARKLIEESSRFQGVIRVGIRQDAEGVYWVDVQDNGVGMSRNVLTRTLLDFGRSLWSGEGLRKEFPGLLSLGIEAAGRFGIGFFSVFMLGEHVIVTTRRYDAANSDTLTLDFRGGLDMRPILRGPTASEALIEPGTRVSVRLRSAPCDEGGICFQRTPNGEKGKRKLSEIVSAICPSLDVTVECTDSSKTVRAVKANDWRKLKGTALLSRIRGGNDELGSMFGEMVRDLEDPEGNIYGRAAIFLQKYHFLFTTASGVVTSGGLRVAKLNYIGGILLGAPLTVTRDSAMPIVPAHILRGWATGQAKLVESSNATEDMRLLAAGIVMKLGGDVGNLPIIRRGGEYLNRSELLEILQGVVEIAVHEGEYISYDEDVDEVLPREFRDSFVQDGELFLLTDRVPHILDVADAEWPVCIDGLYLPGTPRSYEQSLLAAMSSSWGVVPKPQMESRRVGEVSGTDILRDVPVYRRVSR